MTDATPAPAPAPTRDDDALIERVAKSVVARRLAAPAILFLESSKPFAFLGSQTLVFFEPFVRVAAPRVEVARLAALLENRGAIETLVSRIEALEEAARATARRRSR